MAGIDSGFNSPGVLYEDPHPQPPISFKDVRTLDARDLIGFDAVVHLAGISNDPAGDLVPALTRDINLLGTVRTARAARAAGIARFIHFSSCSVYGAGNDETLDETSPTKPLTEYATCKLMAEHAINRLAGKSFTVVSMRNATVFGPSSRMRFDLVLNNLAACAWTTKAIGLTSDGTPWRPLIHVRDLARATLMMLEAPPALVNRQAFNVGDDRLNYQVQTIATMVSSAFPGCTVTKGSNGADARSYKISFAKVRQALGFTCEHSAEAGAEELRRLFERIDLTRATFESPLFDRLRRVQMLIASRAANDSLFWIDTNAQKLPQGSIADDATSAFGS